MLTIRGACVTTKKQLDGKWFTPNCLRQACEWLRADIRSGCIPLLVNHDQSAPAVGRVLSCEFKAFDGYGSGIFVSCEIYDAKFFEEVIETRELNQLSTGADFWLLEEDQSITAIRVDEISLVRVGKCWGTHVIPHNSARMTFHY